MAKRTLIVDDSKTARQVLSSKLQKYGITVDTRESAAAAIDYLYENEPDAIFMDYEMPGMDGFQALKVIKSNPHTALIPVMMYTSKEGGLAMSQARALGAVGVLPKQLEAQDLEAVLQALHLLPEQESLVHGFKDDDYGTFGRVHGADNVRSITESERRKGKVAEHVSLPMESFAESLSEADALKRFIRREQNQSESRLQERLDKHFSELHAELYELQAQQEDQSHQSRRTLLISLVGVLLLIGATLGLYYNMTRTGNLAGLGPTNGMLKEVLALIAAQDEKIDQLSQPIASGADGSDGQVQEIQLPLNLIEWAANQGSAFDFPAMPFDDQRALWLAGLMEKLREAGFRGTVELRANYGNFCLRKDEAGAFLMADPALDINQCLFAADLKSAELQQNEQSVAFANYLNVEAARSGGEIEILLFNSGFSDPILPYPGRYDVKNAGEWNRIARQNQRIRVSLYSNQ